MGARDAAMLAPMGGEGGGGVGGRDAGVVASGSMEEHSIHREPNTEEMVLRLVTTTAAAAAAAAMESQARPV